MPSSLVPLFSIGTPGSVIAAIMIGAFFVRGVTPGPLMFTQQTELVYGIYLAMIGASLLLLSIGFFDQRIFAQVVRVPMRYVIPVVIFFCGMGAYPHGNGIFGVGITLFFGVLGFFARKLGFGFVTFLIGFVIGPNCELTSRQTIALNGGSVGGLRDHPVALVFMALTVLAAWRIVSNQRKKLRAARAARSRE